jgi:hypothetical protein
MNLLIFAYGIFKKTKIILAIVISFATRAESSRNYGGEAVRQAPPRGHRETENRCNQTDQPVQD